MNSIQALRERAAEVGHLQRIGALLDWDMQTYLPHGGSAARAEQAGYLARLAHETLVADETLRRLETAEAEAAGSDTESDDSRLVANMRRDYDRAARVPASLAAEIARHAALSETVWKRARVANDFASFAPALKRTYELARQVAACLTAAGDDPYDALLDGYEPGMRTAEVEYLFAGLKPRLVELVRAIADNSDGRQEALPAGPYPVDVQKAVTERLVRAIGYDMERGRQDQAAHPFCTNFSRDDVRITTRFDETRLEMALYASFHEAGHAMYEQGIAPDYDNTPLGGGASMGVHESQSRMWENLVGRSRPFVEWALPGLKSAFPVLAETSEDRFYRAVNRVEPSFIRVEADEVTYNLHILLRFELERELLAERLSVDDLPPAWNAKMQEYLGITPPTDTVGVLQDVHWSGGLIGYFPTYTLGNLLSTQLWATIQVENGGIAGQIRCGEFQPLLDWLRDRIHKHGRKYKPAELIQRATGRPLTTEPYLDYLREKFGALYAL